MKLNLSFTDNDNIRTRLVDNKAMFLDFSLNSNFENMKKMTQREEKVYILKRMKKLMNIILFLN